MIWLLACAKPTADSMAPAVVVPEEGAWAVTQAVTWEGDCALDNMSSALPAEAEWVLDVRGDHLDVYQTFWTLLWCELDSGAFVCDVGSFTNDYGAEGVATYTWLLSGSFPTSTTVEAAFTLDAGCEGSICEDEAAQIGKKFSFPCSLAAPVSGARVGEG